MWLRHFDGDQPESSWEWYQRNYWLQCGSVISTEIRELRKSPYVEVILELQCGSVISTEIRWATPAAQSSPRPPLQCGSVISTEISHENVETGGAADASMWLRHFDGDQTQAARSTGWSDTRFNVAPSFRRRSAGEFDTWQAAMEFALQCGSVISTEISLSATRKPARADAASMWLRHFDGDQPEWFEEIWQRPVLQCGSVISTEISLDRGEIPPDLRSASMWLRHFDGDQLGRPCVRPAWRPGFNVAPSFRRRSVEHLGRKDAPRRASMWLRHFDGDQRGPEDSETLT